MTMLSNLVEDVAFSVFVPGCDKMSLLGHMLIEGDRVLLEKPGAGIEILNLPEVEPVGEKAFEALLEKGGWDGEESVSAALQLIATGIEEDEGEDHEYAQNLLRVAALHYARDNIPGLWGIVLNPLPDGEYDIDTISNDNSS